MMAKLATAVTIFDGNKCHEVKPLKGQRITVMAYTVKHFNVGRSLEDLVKALLAGRVTTTAPFLTLKVVQRPVTLWLADNDLQ